MRSSELAGNRRFHDCEGRRAIQLLPGQALGVSLELTNPVVPAAIRLTTQDYTFIGWTPRYVVTDLLKAIASHPTLSARVVGVIADDAPLNRRVLIELAGQLPEGYRPMQSEEFQPLTASPVTR